MQTLDQTQLGILRDIAANKIDLDEAGDWMRDKLCEIILLDGPLLIDTQGPSVFLTQAGQRLLSSGKQT
jgi:hypothetical protein